MPVIRDVVVRILSVVVFSVLVSFHAHSADQNEAVFETNKGTIVIALDQVKAPETVANFKSYIESGFYNDTIFHRIIAGFMIQGGGFDENIDRKATKDSIQNEAYNGLKNEIGTIAMARTADPHSATSQFFINVGNNASLNHKAKQGNGWGYAVFGKVIEGMDVVNAISLQKTTRRAGHQNIPVDTVLVKKAYLR
jgi:peptidyl-prolyl cis-trans isomerase B (cyclophilin B)